MDKSTVNNTDVNAKPNTDNVESRPRTGADVGSRVITGRFITIATIDDCRRLDADEMEFRRRALKNAVVCIAILKFFCLQFYVILFFLIHNHIEGFMADVIKIMTITAILPQTVNITLLVVGAYKENYNALEWALWLTLLMASYHTVLGIMGLIYFGTFGFQGYTIVLCIIYAIIASSLIAVLCHDLIIIYAYKQLLRLSQENDFNPTVVVPSDPAPRTT